MSKGIATIIATIILVVITIGLVSTAYLYFAGIVQVGPVVSIASAYCNTTDHIIVTVRNEGTEDITATNLDFLKDGNSVSLAQACAPTNLAAGDTVSCVMTGTDGAVNNILVIGPRNQAGGPVNC